MGTIEFVTLLLAGVGPLLGLSRALRIPATILPFLAGFGVGLQPGQAPLQGDPDLVIWLFLPPIIHGGAVRVTPHSLALGVVEGLFGTRSFHEAKGRPHVPRALGDSLKVLEMTARIAALVVLGLIFDALPDGEAPGVGEGALIVAWSLLGAPLPGRRSAGRCFG